MEEVKRESDRSVGTIFSGALIHIWCSSESRSTTVCVLKTVKEKQCVSVMFTEQLSFFVGVLHDNLRTRTKVPLPSEPHRSEDVVLYLCDVQVLLVTLNSVGEVSQCRVHGAHVAQLPGLAEPTLGLSGQQHALFVARQGVGVVADCCVHMTQTAEGVGRSLKQHRTLVSVQISETIHRDGKQPADTETA